jgi:hypothetical protein
MKIKSLALTTAIAIGGTISTGSATPAGAFNLFFGEDIDANTSNSATSLQNSNTAKNSFLSSLIPTNPSTEGFESITPGFYTTIGLSNITGASISTTSPTGGVSDNNPNINPNTNPNKGRFAISGSQYYEVGSTTVGGAKTTTTVTFASPIAAFGFYATDIENADGITLQLNDSNNTTLTRPRSAQFNPDGISPLNKSGSALFYGFIAQNPGETFNSVTFNLVSTETGKVNDRFSLDNLTVATSAEVRNFGAAATSVPEPLTMMGTLLGGGVVLRLRKKLKTIRK